MRTLSFAREVLKAVATEAALSSVREVVTIVGEKVRARLNEKPKGKRR